MYSFEESVFLLNII